MAVGSMKKRYALLLSTQAIGSIFLLYQCVPIYSRVVDDPGHPQSFGLLTIAFTVLSIALVQCAYWHRVFRVMLPVRPTRVVLGHFILFAGRLDFIVASALYSVVLFRHLPEIDYSRDLISFVWRGVLFLAALFSIFCFTTELDRLGAALRG